MAESGLAEYLSRLATGYDRQPQPRHATFVLVESLSYVCRVDSTIYSRRAGSSGATVCIKSERIQTSKENGTTDLYFRLLVDTGFVSFVKS